jgi:hypothetical protein
LSAATSKETTFSLLHQDLWHNKTIEEWGLDSFVALVAGLRPLRRVRALNCLDVLPLSSRLCRKRKGSWAFAPSFLFLSLLLALRQRRASDEDEEKDEEKDCRAGMRRELARLSKRREEALKAEQRLAL